MLTVLTLTSGAFADCFNFVNGNGPDRIGNYEFTNKATSICLEAESTITNRNYTSVIFYDADGELAYISADKTLDQCTGVCAELALRNGLIDNKSLNLEGHRIVIKTEYDKRLNVVKGSLEIRTSRSFPAKFNVFKAR